MIMNVICETKNIDASGTSLIGYLNLTYNEIVSIFGKPIKLNGYNKVEWEWVFKLNDSILTIYNWKDGPGYTKDKKIKPKDISDWHVGGKYNYDLKILKDYILTTSKDNKFFHREIIKEE